MSAAGGGGKINTCTDTLYSVLGIRMRWSYTEYFIVIELQNNVGML
jgi:hypothetical protein